MRLLIAMFSFFACVATASPKTDNSPFTFISERTLQSALSSRDHTDQAVLLEELSRQLDLAEQDESTAPKVLADITLLYSVLRARSEKKDQEDVSLRLTYYQKLAARRVREAYGKQSIPAAYVHLASMPAESDWESIKSISRRALLIAKHLHGESSAAYFHIESTIGSLIGQRNYWEAVRYLESAKNGFMKVAPCQLTKRADIAVQLANIHQRRDPRKSVALLIEATELYAEAGLGYSGDNLVAHLKLASFYRNSDETSLAELHDAAPTRFPPPGGSSPPLLLTKTSFPESVGWSAGSREVVLSYRVDADGKVRDIEVQGVSSEYPHSRTAASYLKQYRYRPQFVDSVPVASERMEIRIEVEAARGLR